MYQSCNSFGGIVLKQPGPIPNWYKPRIGTNLLYQPRNSNCQRNHIAYGAGAYSRISSKYIVPEPPANGLFLLPRPREIVLTLVRFTPRSAKACRSIFHSVQVANCAASGLSFVTIALGSEVSGLPYLVYRSNTTCPFPQ